MKLVIEVEFDHELSSQAQIDIRKHIQDLKEEFEILGGKMKRAELSKA